MKFSNYTRNKYSETHIQEIFLYLTLINAANLFTRPISNWCLSVQNSN